MPLTNKQKAAATARTFRWPGDPESRWKTKSEGIILFIARLGWATVELVNFYFEQSSEAWPKRLNDQGILYREKVTVKNSANSRRKSNNRIMTILLLTDKGQKMAREIDSRIGKRISAPSSDHLRHDFIAFWIAAFFARDMPKYFADEIEYEVWSDQVMRGFIHDVEHRPDAAIYQRGEPFVRIEVERSKKKTGLEEYRFMRKLEAYSACEDCHTFIVTETQARYNAIIELLGRAEREGVRAFFRNEYSGIWFPYDHKEQFDCCARVILWDYARKTFTGYKHNL